MGNCIGKKQEQRAYDWHPIHNLEEYNDGGYQNNQARNDGQDVEGRIDYEEEFKEKTEEIEKMSSFLSKKAQSLLAKTKTGEVS